MKISIQMLLIGETEFHFLFDKKHLPVIEVKGNNYDSLALLVNAFPQILEIPYLEKLAQIANFLANGLEFQYIEDIELFKESYRQQIEAEQFVMNHETRRLRDYGIYDLSLMHPPDIRECKLVFYVKHDYLAIPYQASLTIPVTTNPPQISYELLPVL